MLAIIACILCLLVFIFYAVVNLINYKIGNNFLLVRSLRSFFCCGNPVFNMRQIPSGTDQDEDAFLRSVGYEVGSTIGVGAYAAVKEAYSQKYKTKVAIKIITKQDGSVDRFLQREIEVLRRVEHKSIVKVYEAIESTNKFYLVMELAQTDLLQLLQQRGPLSEREAKSMFRKIIKGVDYCHKRGIVHRDLKLENILLTKKCEPIITDFGFARFVFNTGGSEGRSRSETFCGSHAYAAPEILQGIPYDAVCSDTWSLGVILYTMTCGQFPFDDKNKNQLLRETTSGKLKFPRSAETISKPLKHLILRMLTPNKHTRIVLEDVLKHPWFKENIFSGCTRGETSDRLEQDKNR